MYIVLKMQEPSACVVLFVCVLLCVCVVLHCMCECCAMC